MGTAAVVFVSGALMCGAQSLVPAVDSDALLRAAVSPAAFAGAAASAPLLRMDAAANGSGSEPVSSSAMDELPDAPEPQDSQKPLVAASPKTVPATTEKPVVSRYVKYVPAGAAAPQIHGREKLILGARDLYSAGNFLDMFASAGWEHLTNSQPNYGTNSTAFAQRLGAAAIRETTEGILTDGVFSVMLHEDPRYFVLGPQYGLVHRTLYAITRPLVTRDSTDGHHTINGALLLGYAGSTAMQNMYYPDSNRNFHDNASSYAESIGGAALGFFVDEFETQALEMLHLKKKQ